RRIVQGHPRVADVLTVAEIRDERIGDLLAEGRVLRLVILGDSHLLGRGRPLRRDPADLLAGLADGGFERTLRTVELATREAPGSPLYTLSGPRLRNSASPSGVTSPRPAAFIVQKPSQVTGTSSTACSTSTVRRSRTRAR